MSDQDSDVAAFQAWVDAASALALASLNYRQSANEDTGTAFDEAMTAMYWAELDLFQRRLRPADEHLGAWLREIMRGLRAAWCAIAKGGNADTEMRRIHHSVTRSEALELDLQAIMTTK